MTGERKVPVERGTVDEREAFEVTADRILKAYPDGRYGCVVLPVAIAEVILAYALAGRGEPAT